VLLVESRHYIKTPREQRIDLIARVAVAHGLTVADLLGPSHKRKLAYARWEAMAAIKAEFDDSLPMIGRLFNRDHTSVLHGLRKVAAL
jgi:chromosomal replication initiation ATPase DnaA